MFEALILKKPWLHLTRSHVHPGSKSHLVRESPLAEDWKRRSKLSGDFLWLFELRISGCSCDDLQTMTESSGTEQLGFLRFNLGSSLSCSVSLNAL